MTAANALCGICFAREAFVPWFFVTCRGGKPAVSAGFSPLAFNEINWLQDKCFARETFVLSFATR